jgi:putative transposase
MAKLEHYFTKFEEGKFYHVYNRTVDKQPMFKNAGNCIFFLKKFDEYLSPVIDLYSYCLLGNHFHVLVRIKLTEHNNSSYKIKGEDPVSTHDLVCRQFRKFFQSYAMAFNKQHNRVGTLFQTPFKRALIQDNAHFTQLVYYIHANPELHKLIDDFRKWRWSSYKSLLNEKSTKLKKQEVIAWFGDLESFEAYHNLIYTQDIPNTIEEAANV